MNREKIMKTNVLDLLGMSVSGLCVVHCLLTPLLLVFSPIYWGELFAHETVHLLFLILGSSFALLSLNHGYRKHQQLSILFLGAIGLLLLFLALTFIEGSSYEIGVTLLGGLLLISAHFKNWRACGCNAQHCEITH